MKKKFIPILFASCFLLSGCTNSSINEDDDPIIDNKDEEKEDDKKEDNDKKDDKKDDSEDKEDEESSEPTKSIVVYFSATNNTKKVAEMIASYIESDTFELVPVNPYTLSDLNYNDSSSRVVKEHNDSSLQDIELVSIFLPDYQNIKNIFIGFPIWWGNAAWPVNNFIKNNDFTNKFIYPFATSVSSGLGNSVTNLKALNSTGTWNEGRRFRSSANENDVKEWIDSLSL